MSKTQLTIVLLPLFLVSRNHGACVHPWQAAAVLPSARAYDACATGHIGKTAGFAQNVNRRPTLTPIDTVASL
jgi:hypothetical protein